MGLNQEKKVWIIGHKNPDTDSICAAIAYADLKNKISEIKHEPKRAGSINEETRYVLDFFQVEEPELVTDVRAQMKDISFRRTAGVSDHISLKRAWELMKTEDVVTLPVTGVHNRLQGLIVTSDIATSYMDVYDNRVLATAKTLYKNIAETLAGTILAGNEHAYFMKGRVVAETSGPDWMDEYMEPDDLVILGGHTSSQMRAIENNASCLVVCLGLAVSKEVIEAADRRDCVVIGTPYDTFTAARLINQSMPIKYFMTKKNLIQFDLEDYVDDVKDVMSKVRHRDFPIVDEENNYVGMVSRRYLLNTQKKQIILVDHNEKTQAVDGIAGAEILEIIDHHRLGSLETISPVFFRNQPVGCTATIVYQMYLESDVKITPTIAGLLCSAIISDTLLFRSPTCTQVDEKAAKKLAKLADINLEQMAGEMFKAGSSLTGKSADEICFQDFKQFTVNDVVFGVGQINSMNKDELKEIREVLTPHLPEVLKSNNLQMVYFMLTDILDESTELLCVGNNAKEYIIDAFDLGEDTDKVVLKGVVSRKKQLIPTLVGTLQQ